MNSNNPFLNDDNDIDPFHNCSDTSPVQDNSASLPQDNPFIEKSILKEDLKEEKKKHGFFHKKDQEEEEEKTVTLSLRDVQNMSFPVENTQYQTTPVTTPPQDESFDATVNRSIDWLHAFKKNFRRFRTLFEIVLIAFVIIFGTIKYNSYSSKTNQLLIYQLDGESFEVKRIKGDLHVQHKKEVCDKECTMELVEEYSPTYSSFQKILVMAYFDFTFTFQNGSKQITNMEVSSSFSSKAIYSLIHNDNLFLSFHRNRGYSVIDYETLGENVIRGYSYEEDKGHFYVTVSLGLKQTSGYTIDVYDVHEIEGDFIIYISEGIPKKVGKWINENSPSVVIELNNKPNSIKVINVMNGEEFHNL